ncbi:winged helix-turn-helix transcriptional regulator, partial [bacterium]
HNMNIKNNLSEKEIRVIEQFSNNGSVTQRDISKKLGFSLGLTNIITKRLVKMGYVKVKQLDKRKVEYLLTPKGFTEKAKKTYNYFVKTINGLGDIKEIIQKAVLSEYENGFKYFCILGNSDFNILTEIAIRDLQLGDIGFKKIQNIEEISDGSAVITLEPVNIENNIKTISINDMLKEVNTGISF